MKVSDYIVEFLISKGINHVFGYPGGMVTHLMNSFSKYENQIQAHVCYHEQAAAFEACAYAQVSGIPGVAYATSGPGATNMITGICNAYFDSVPVIFITGQVNTFEAKQAHSMRQRGFQETDIISMVKEVTKYAVYVEDADKIGEYLEKAYQIAMTGRKGPVLLDIPMNIQRTDIDLSKTKVQNVLQAEQYSVDYTKLNDLLQAAKRPCMVLGAALKNLSRQEVLDYVEYMQMPVVTSMIAMDILPYEHPLNYGFIGAYGSRTANFIVAKSDCVFVLGSRLDVRQVGGKRDNFAPDALIVRVDIDAGELQYQIRDNEIDIHADIKDVMNYLRKQYTADRSKLTAWHHVCDEIANRLDHTDDRNTNRYVEAISQYVPEGTVITTDVGQNQVWVAQSYHVKSGQCILYSGGHGAMGYSLPAAIGAYYASGLPVISFNGDGGIQMNIQEMEFIRREKLPIKIFVFNNHALGMIRHFQEMYFDSNYMQTVEGRGYETPDFERLANAYHMHYLCYNSVEDVSDEFMRLEGAVLIEIQLKEDTYVFPKLEFGKPNQDQEPLIDRTLFKELMDL